MQVIQDVSRTSIIEFNFVVRFKQSVKIEDGMCKNVVSFLKDKVTMFASMLGLMNWEGFIAFPLEWRTHFTWKVPFIQGSLPDACSIRGVVRRWHPSKMSASLSAFSPCCPTGGGVKGRNAVIERVNQERWSEILKCPTPTFRSSVGASTIWYNCQKAVISILMDAKQFEDNRLSEFLRHSKVGASMFFTSYTATDDGWERPVGNVYAHEAIPIRLIAFVTQVYRPPMNMLPVCWGTSLCLVRGTSTDGVVRTRPTWRKSCKQASQYCRSSRSFRHASCVEAFQQTLQRRRWTQFQLACNWLSHQRRCRVLRPRSSDDLPK